MCEKGKYRAAIFDLDGVVVNTAEFHYLAWREIAAQFGKEFSRKQNERLKGVSRRKSLEILLEECGIAVTEQEKEKLMLAKNGRYVEMLDTLTREDILPGIADFLIFLQRRGIRTVLGSASKNAPFILQKLQIENLFDIVIDGNSAVKGKPDPEVFLIGSRAAGIVPAECVVFEDARVGVEAAAAGGMGCVGIGSAEELKAADMVVPDLSRWRELIPLFRECG